MASTSWQEEALGQVDEIARELAVYNGGSYKQLQEQTLISRCKDALERVKTVIMAKEPDGNIRAERLSAGDWLKIANVIIPLARCFTAGPHSPLAPTAKTRHASATALAALALLSSCNPKSKIIVTSALENGVVGACVNTLRNSLRNPVPDRANKAMRYKLTEALWGFNLYATAQHHQDMVAKDVVNVCMDLVTAPTVETESKLIASRTLYGFLVSNNRAVTELRSSTVNALNNQLQQLASMIPDPASLMIGRGGASSAKAISIMPELLPAFMSWIWFLPTYILDDLMGTLSRMLSRIVLLVWPEGSPGIPLLEPGRDSGPLHVAQLSLIDLALRNTMENLFNSIASGMADPRLVSILHGARSSDLLDVDVGLPARLVRVVKEGRSDRVETTVALELLDKLFACGVKGNYPELAADDALVAGLLAAMTEMDVLHALRTKAGVAAFVRLASKLVKLAHDTPSLASRLRDSGVPASVAYLAFMPVLRSSLKLEALQTLLEMVRLDAEMTEHVVAMNNFPTALSNTLLGGENPDPDAQKQVAGDILTVVLDAARDNDKVRLMVAESGMLQRLCSSTVTPPMQPAPLAELLLAVAKTSKGHWDDRGGQCGAADDGQQPKKRQRSV